jgi:hypothetical protein
MTNYFMRTYGQSAGFGDPFTNDMDTAMLDVTHELIDVCRQRAKRVLKLASQETLLWELLFWDEWRLSWWDFYPSDLIESMGLIGAEEAADNGELVEPTDPGELKRDQACAVECAQMRVLVYRQNRRSPVCEFGWGAYRKHSDVWVTTPTFSLACLEELLAKSTV